MPADAWELPSAPVERYRMGEVIGRGGLGEVYRAEDTQLCRSVAIKRLHAADGEAVDGAAHILQEARHLAALQHPNIVTVYDVIASRGDIVVVMELLQGKTLQEIAEIAPLLPEDFVAIMGQALQGLIAAHALGMLHRDIKPSNLMLSQLPSGESQLKILDFGMAKRTPGPSKQTKDQDGALMGSIYMMSPEQLEGTPLDERSDLYSLGCVAYFALTASYPFSGKTVVEVITAHLQGRKTPLTQFRGDLPPRLCAWVERMMAVHPEDRFSSATAALEELRRVFDPVVPALAPPPAPDPAVAAPGVPVRTDRTFRLPRIRLSDIAVGAFLVVICAFSYSQFLKITRPATAQASVPVIAATDRDAIRGRIGQTVVVEGTLGTVSERRDGGLRRLAFAGSGPHDLSLVFFSTGSAAELVRRIDSYSGRTVRVTGTVSEKSGAPEILIDSFSQIETL